MLPIKHHVQSIYLRSESQFYWLYQALLIVGKHNIYLYSEILTYVSTF